MKRILYILSFVVLSVTAAQAQDDAKGDKIRERMTEYIQKRLDLSKSEADKFAPVFMDYFNELRKTNNQYRGDRLVLQQKIVDLRLRYRDQFKTIMGEKRGNDVFKHEHEFVETLKDVRRERMQNGGGQRPGKRLNGPLQ